MFKKTGNIDTFLELTKIENLESSLKVQSLEQNLSQDTKNTLQETNIPSSFQEGNLLNNTKNNVGNKEEML